MERSDTHDQGFRQTRFFWPDVLPVLRKPEERLARKNAFDGSLVMGVRAFHQATGRSAHRAASWVSRKSSHEAARWADRPVA